jgi:hypothetical protein
MKLILKNKADDSVIKAIDDVEDIQKGLCETLRVAVSGKAYMIPIADTEYIELVYEDCDE